MLQQMKAFALMDFANDATGVIQSLGVANGKRSQFSFGSMDQREVLCGMCKNPITCMFIFQIQ